MELDSYMDNLWTDFCKINPQAQKILKNLSDRGEKVLNDHIALRTIDFDGIDSEALGKVFEAFGYEKKNEYKFEEKKLVAFHWEKSGSPRVFISHLLIDQFSPFLFETMKSLGPSLKTALHERGALALTSGTHWKRSYEVFEKLAAESEYAGWFYNFGFRPNHFTVDVNSLKSIHSIQEMNELIKSIGYQLNTSGGEIKGSKESLLEQSSTLASRVSILFEEGAKEVPGCYYEFALRHPDKSGQLFQGFVAGNADKIFESTHT